MKDGLRPAIVPGLVPTLATGLARVTRVNLDHTDTAYLGFVLDKRVQLSERPAMQTSLVVTLRTRLFASAHPRSITNVLQIFQHDGSALGGVLDNPLGEDVIVISASPKLFATQLLEMSLGRAAAFGLQLAFQAEGASFLLFPSLLAQELTSRGDSRPIETQVYPDHVLGGTNSRFRDGDNDMERKAPLAIAQVCATRLMADVLHKVSRHRERQFNAPVHRSQTTGHALPLDPVRTLVIADTNDLTVRATNRLESRNGLALRYGLLNPSRVCLLLLGLPDQSRFHGFSGLDAGRAHQLSRKVRILCSQRIVGAFMQLHAIATGCGKALAGNGIEANRMLLKCCLEYLGLLWCVLQLYNYRSIHVKSFSYIALYCQVIGFDRPTPRKECLSSRPVSGDGSPGDLRDDNS